MPNSSCELHPSDKDLKMANFKLATQKDAKNNISNELENLQLKAQEVASHKVEQEALQKLLVSQVEKIKQFEAEIIEINKLDHSNKNDSDSLRLKQYVTASPFYKVYELATTGLVPLAAASLVAGKSIPSILGGGSSIIQYIPSIFVSKMVYDNFEILKNDPLILPISVISLPVGYFLIPESITLGISSLYLVKKAWDYIISPGINSIPSSIDFGPILKMQIGPAATIGDKWAKELIDYMEAIPALAKEQNGIDAMDQWFVELKQHLSKISELEKQKPILQANKTQHELQEFSLLELEKQKITENKNYEAIYNRLKPLLQIPAKQQEFAKEAQKHNQALIEIDKKIAGIKDVQEHSIETIESWDKKISDEVMRHKSVIEHLTNSAKIKNTAYQIQAGTAVKLEQAELTKLVNTISSISANLKHDEAQLINVSSQTKELQEKIDNLNNAIAQDAELVKCLEENYSLDN